MTTFGKPYSTPDQQIALLRGRGLAIPNEEKARVCLKRVGYYRLSAYWYPFRKMAKEPVASKSRRADEFVSGANFDDVIDFYVFDKGLRMLVSDALERIEIALRAEIASHLGARDPWAHRNPRQLHGDFSTKPSYRDPSASAHTHWLSGQDSNFLRSKEDFANHFRESYPKSDPPIWVATEVWDWGMLSHFYSGMQHKDMDAVACNYGPLTGKEFKTWVHALNDIRNVCAHHSRLWNRALKVEPKMPKRGICPDLDHIVGQTKSLTRIYGALVIMTYIMRSLHPLSEWHTRVRKHIALAPKNPIIGPETAGFPEHWADQAIWAERR